MPSNVIFRARNATEFHDEMRRKGELLLWDRLSPGIQIASISMEDNCRECPHEVYYRIGDEKRLFICEKNPFSEVPACAKKRGEIVLNIDDQVNEITRTRGVEFR